VFSLCLKVHFLNAQQTLDSLSVVKSLKNIPNFTINKDNYFITGSKLGLNLNNINADAKLQVSFKMRLHKNAMPFNTFLFFVYTQKSFWNIYLDSSPFVETNYNPSLSLARSMFRHKKLHGVLAAQFEHESNGMGGIESRSWNCFSVSYFGVPSKKIRYFVKAWAPFLYSDNKNLMEYIGYSEARLTWVTRNNRLIFDLTCRKAPALDWRGNIQAECSWQPFKLETFHIFVQWWEGYAESLLHYNESSSRVRIGIVFKPSYFTFY
jgi:phospholipase A1/A2